MKKNEPIPTPEALPNLYITPEVQAHSKGLAAQLARELSAKQGELNQTHNERMKAQAEADNPYNQLTPEQRERIKREDIKLNIKDVYSSEISPEQRDLLLKGHKAEELTKSFVGGWPEKIAQLKDVEKRIEKEIRHLTVLYGDYSGSLKGAKVLNPESPVDGRTLSSLAVDEPLLLDAWRGAAVAPHCRKDLATKDMRIAINLSFAARDHKRIPLALAKN